MLIEYTSIWQDTQNDITPMRDNNKTLYNIT